MIADQYQACIEACNACATQCETCAASCLIEPSVQHMANCIALDLDCAAYCRMTASLLARGSQFVELVCQDCAEICHACAEECSQHAMQHCQQCAEACRRCAEACLKLGVAQA